jgi:cytochrome oxidase assembly protein ShyY1
MIGRVPLIPTVIVALCIAAMIGAGLWQIDRARYKEAMAERFTAARTLPAIAWPNAPVAEAQLPLFRHARGLCLQVLGPPQLVAGRNARGESGYSHQVDCRTGAEGPGMRVDIGWSRDPHSVARWSGGPVSGLIAPDKQHRLRLVSDRGLAGLEASAPPSPGDIPNNSRSYAVQWFGFAATAAIIYLLALRSRRRRAPANGEARK